MPNILEKLAGTEVAGAWQANGLQVFGLKWAAENGHDYLTLDEALHDKLLDLSEIDTDGRVPTLKVVNKAEKMVFLMAGEELVGGKQNRVLNASMMVPAKGELPVPVTCVERGRWGYKSSTFASGNTTSHPRLRMMISKQSSASYKVRGVAESDQGAVWSEVARKMKKMGSSSSSDALHDLFEDYAKRLDTMLEHLPPPSGCHGAGFAIHGKVVGADLFDRPATLGKLWPKLIKSYAADALEDPKESTPPVKPEQVTTWLKSASSAEQHWFDSPGLGKDVRIEGERLVGATLVIDNKPIHLELFREEVRVPAGQEV